MHRWGQAGLCPHIQLTTIISPDHATKHSRLQTLRCHPQCRCLPTQFEQCPSHANTEMPCQDGSANKSPDHARYTITYMRILGCAAILQAKRSTEMRKDHRQECISSSVARAVAEGADSMPCHTVGSTPAPGRVGSSCEGCCCAFPAWVVAS
jgi:hypothetical protein